MAVIVTRNRARLLERCLRATRSQTVPPLVTIIVDDAGEVPLCELAEANAPCELLKLPRNQGAAAAYAAGIERALALNADFVWMMDDDGLPERSDCLASLLNTAERERAHLTAPLVRDVDAPQRLAFPIRWSGITRFNCHDFDQIALIENFAHLFNGVLVARQVFETIGLPDSRLFIRGDEVDFLFRARRAGLRIVTNPAIGFLHPASNHEIHRMFGGQFYAVVPTGPIKQFYQFRNRGWLFSRYGLWHWLFADHLRYGLYYLAYARDPRAFGRWLRITWLGVFGRLQPLAEASGLGERLT